MNDMQFLQGTICPIVGFGHGWAIFSMVHRLEKSSLELSRDLLHTLGVVLLNIG